VKFNIGPLVKVGSVADIAAEYRTSGTQYLAEVTATVEWIGEPARQQMHYPENFDEGYSRSIKYAYTLEFDAKKQLIGGEWGSLKAIDPSAHAPDFLFGYESGAEPEDFISTNPDSINGIQTYIDYSGIIKKLLACSQSGTADGQIAVGTQQLDYKNCPIEVSAQ
jgi:hypothetical protein